jgi:3-oxoacyl-(acyl-carrier-protein) synthase
MRMERVVITGMGTVNALAKNTAAFARALQEGACGIGLMTCVKPREMNKPA